VVERFARELAGHFGCCVDAITGIHYEGPTRADLDAILAVCWELLEQTKAEMEKTWTTNS
jgi:hypothetical protein